MIIPIAQIYSSLIAFIRIAIYHILVYSLPVDGVTLHWFQYEPCLTVYYRYVCHSFVFIE